MIEFKEMSVLKFITDVLNAKEFAIEELNYYFIVNDTFFPIDEITVYTGGVTIRNTYHNIELDVDTSEQGMIWYKTER